MNTIISIDQHLNISAFFLEITLFNFLDISKFFHDCGKGTMKRSLYILAQKTESNPMTSLLLMYMISSDHVFFLRHELLFEETINIYIYATWTVLWTELLDLSS